MTDRDRWAAGDGSLIVPLTYRLRWKISSYQGPVSAVLARVPAAGVGCTNLDRARNALSSPFGWSTDTGTTRANGDRNGARLA